MLLLFHGTLSAIAGILTKQNMKPHYLCPPSSTPFGFGIKTLTVRSFPDEPYAQYVVERGRFCNTVLYYNRYLCRVVVIVLPTRVRQHRHLVCKLYDFPSFFAHTPSISPNTFDYHCHYPKRPDCKQLRGLHLRLVKQLNMVSLPFGQRWEGAQARARCRQKAVFECSNVRRKGGVRSIWEAQFLSCHCSRPDVLLSFFFFFFASALDRLDYEWFRETFPHSDLVIRQISLFETTHVPNS